MATRTKTGGGTGTNQYAVKGKSVTADNTRVYFTLEDIERIIGPDGPQPVNEDIANLAPLLVKDGLTFKNATRTMRLILDAWEEDQSAFRTLQLDEGGCIERFVAAHPDWLRKMYQNDVCSSGGAMYLDILFVGDDSEFCLVQEDEAGEWTYARGDQPGSMTEDQIRDAEEMDEFERKAAVVTDQGCRPSVLRGYADDPDMAYFVAKHPRTPLDVLIAMADSDDESVLEGLSENEDCPSEILDKVISRDIPRSVKEKIAASPNLSVEAMDTLSKDFSWKVRKAVGLNPNCPKRLKDKLAKDIGRK